MLHIKNNKTQESFTNFIEFMSLTESYANLTPILYLYMFGYIENIQIIPITRF